MTSSCSHRTHRSPLLRYQRYLPSESISIYPHSPYDVTSAVKHTPAVIPIDDHTIVSVPLGPSQRVYLPRIPKIYVHLTGLLLDRERLDVGMGRHRGEDKKDPAEQTTLVFADFVLRDLKANEVVVLGWQWDDKNAVHPITDAIHVPVSCLLSSLFSL